MEKDLRKEFCCEGRLLDEEELDCSKKSESVRGYLLYAMQKEKTYTYKM